MGDLTPYEEVCESCGARAEGEELRTGDEGTPVARWAALPPGWLSSFDDAGEHVVCSTLCARKVDTLQRARAVRGGTELPPRMRRRL